MTALDFTSWDPHMFATSANGGILEMRLKLVAVAGLFALSATGSVQAMEMRQKDADDFRAGLLNSFPDLANSDFLTVRPAGDRLEVILDFNGFFDGLDPKTFRITGFGPWSFFFAPQDNNVAKINAEDRVKASLLAKGVDGKAIEGNYSIESFVLDGLIVLPGSTQIKTLAKNIDFSSKLGGDQSTFRADSIDSTNILGSSDEGKGRWDYDGSAFFSGVYQRSIQSEAPVFEISADLINHEYHWANVASKEVINLASLLITRGVGTVSDFERVRAEMLRSFPLLSSLDERIYTDNLKVTSPIGNLSAKKLNARVALQGETAAAMRLGMTVSGTDIKVDGATIPSGYAALLPASLDMTLVLDGMDFVAAGKELAAGPVWNQAQAEEMGRRFASKLSREGTLPFVLKQLVMRSDFYDLVMFGSARENDEKKAQLKLWITARDFDKSIAAVQEFAKTRPEFNEVSLVMMMAKGFAKTDADGGAHWDVFLNEDGTLIVNGQQVQGPENAAQAQ